MAYVDANRLRRLVMLEANAALLDAISEKEWAALDAV